MHGEKNELFLRLAWTAVTDGMFSISRKKEKKFVSWTEIREVSGGRTQGVPSLLCGATESIQWKKIIEEARVKTKVGSHVDDLNQQSTQR